MNAKSVFSTVKELLGGVTTILASLVTVGVMSQIVFGTGVLGIDVVGNISALVTTFLTGGFTGLLTLIVLFALWTDK